MFSSQFTKNEESNDVKIILFMQGAIIKNFLKFSQANDINLVDEHKSYFRYIETAVEQKNVSGSECVGL